MTRGRALAKDSLNEPTKQKRGWIGVEGKRYLRRKSAGLLVWFGSEWVCSTRQRLRWRSAEEGRQRHVEGVGIG
ncbi:hypothetical protein ACJRO7_014683, partial [Eucalyptus globulus]